MPLLVLWSFPLLIQIRVKSSLANYQLIYGMPVHLAQALFLAFGLILQRVCSQIWRLSLAKATSPILFDILQLSVWIIPPQSSFLFWFYYLLWLLFTSLILPVQNLWKILLLFSLSLQFSLSVMSDSLRPHEPQHTRPSCPSPTPRVHPNPWPLSWWCHQTISSSVVPFTSCPQSFSASGSFQMSQLFASGGQTIGVSASTSVPLMNTQGWSPLGWTGWISLQSKRLSRVFSNTTVQKHQFFSTQLSL